jgi:hypothetical protein
MSNSTLVLWVDGQQGILQAGWQALTTASNPNVVQGDNLSIELHWIKKSLSSSTVMEEVAFPVGSVVRLAIGNPLAVPNSGTFDIVYGGSTITVSAIIAPADLATALNAIPAIASTGGVSVILVNGATYRITFNNPGTQTLMATNATNLMPSATAAVQRVRAGTSTVREIQNIKLKCSPIAYVDTFTDNVDATVSYSQIGYNTTRFSINPTPKGGSFIITDGTNTTAPISVNTTSALLYSALVNAGIADSNYSYSVISSGAYSWDVAQLTNNFKALSANSSGIVSFTSKVGVLNLNTEEVEDFLNGKQSGIATLEINVSDDSGVQTLYQGPVQIFNDLIDASTYSPLALSSPASQADIDALKVRVGNLEANEIPSSISNPLNLQVLAYNSSNQTWTNMNTVDTFPLLDGGNF